MLVKITGAIDPHTHLRDLDWKAKGDFETETIAALFGGYWAVLDMPNTSPATVSKKRLIEKKQRIAHNALCDWGLYFGANSGDNYHEYTHVASEATALKIYTNYTTGDLLIDDETLVEAHFKNWNVDKVIAVHAEDEKVLMVLQWVRKYKRRTHFVHICTRKELAYLQKAKEEKLPISIGVCPHHLYFTELDLKYLKGYGMMKPSLKTVEDKEALWQGIRSGLIDVLESDHAPHTQAEKESANIPFGVTGLQTNIPLLLRAVHEQKISLNRAIAMVSTNVHQVFNLKVPPNTYTIMELEKFEIKNQDMQYKCGWTPYHGMYGYGKVREVCIRGVKVFDGEKVLVSKGFGKEIHINTTN